MTTLMLLLGDGLHSRWLTTTICRCHIMWNGEISLKCTNVSCAILIIVNWFVLSVCVCVCAESQWCVNRGGVCLYVWWNTLEFLNQIQTGLLVLTEDRLVCVCVWLCGCVAVCVWVCVPVVMWVLSSSAVKTLHPPFLRRNISPTQPPSFSLLWCHCSRHHTQRRGHTTVQSVFLVIQLYQTLAPPSYSVFIFFRRSSDEWRWSSTH